MYLKDFKSSILEIKFVVVKKYSFEFLYFEDFFIILMGRFNPALQSPIQQSCDYFVIHLFNLSQFISKTD